MTESNEQGRRRRMRTDSQSDSDAAVVAYEDESGKPRAWTGDEVAPYVILAGQLAAINVIIAGGVAQQVMGDIAHDAVDLPLTSFPVKVGGFASAAPRANVSADGDRASASTDRRGRLRSRVSGETVAGAGVDVQVDAVANLTEAQNLLGIHDPTVGISTGAAVVTDLAGTLQQYLRGLVSRSSTALQGLFAVGNVAHDAVDSNNPVKIGGYAAALAPASVSADADRVNQWSDLEGRAQVNHPQLIAGEDLVHHVLAVVEEPQADEQHSLDVYSAPETVVASGAVLIKAAPGRFYEVRMVLAVPAVADYWMMLINKSSAAPVNNEDPIWRVACPTGALECSDSFPMGLFCDTGLGIAISSTADDLTLVASVARFQVQYK